MPSSSFPSHDSSHRHDLRRGPRHLEKAPRNVHDNDRETAMYTQETEVGKKSQNYAASDEESFVGTVDSGQNEQMENAEDSPSSEDDNPNPWVAAGTRRRAFSLDSSSNQNKFRLNALEQTRVNSDKIRGNQAKKPVPLAMATIGKAERNTRAQKNETRRQTRSDKHNSTHKNLSDNSWNEEGLFKDKGNGMDPMNWGASEPDTDINQHGAIENFRAVRDNAQQQQMPKKKSSKKPEWAKLHEIPEAFANQVEPRVRDIVGQHPRKSHAIKRIASPSSSLTTTNLTKGKKQAVEQQSKCRREPSESSSSSSGSESSSSSPESDLESSFETRHNHGHRGRQRRSHKKKSKKMILKPDPPEPYDGSIDINAYIKFVTEGTAYVRDGHVPRNRRVLKLSKYLKSKAYQFYLTTVANSPFDWRLKEFFVELYNYCFPATYRIDQRRKLEHATQGNKSVRDYLAQINNLFSTVGILDEREKVHKLWTSLNANIQKGLWKEKLNPELSTYIEVASTAELIEIMENNITDSSESEHSSAQRSESEYSSEEEDDSEIEQASDSNFYSENRSDEDQSDSKSKDHSESDNESGSDNQYENNEPDDSSDSDHPRNTYQHRSQRRRLSENKRIEYLATGRCFRCGGYGHISRYCPNGYITETSWKNRTADIELGMMSFALNEPVSPFENDNRKTVREVGKHSHSMGKKDFVFNGHREERKEGGRMDMAPTSRKRHTKKRTPTPGIDFALEDLPERHQHIIDTNFLPIKNGGYEHLTSLKRVRNNKILIKPYDGYTHFVTVSDVRTCLDFDRILRKRSFRLQMADIPAIYPLLAEHVNSDPLIHPYQLATFNVDTGIVYTQAPPIDRRLFDPFTREDDLRINGLDKLTTEGRGLHRELQKKHWTEKHVERKDWKKGYQTKVSMREEASSPGSSHEARDPSGSFVHPSTPRDSTISTASKTASHTDQTHLPHPTHTSFEVSYSPTIISSSPNPSLLIDALATEETPVLTNEPTHNSCTQSFDNDLLDPRVGLRPDRSRYPRRQRSSSN
ncbi:hypothetical protein GG344DRAFT_78374 [Lentinula edodes]|nr:hypothetical protein GG344DRAFT_78374 [Lentinula edodes]